jgi:hypothetical protein
MISTATVLYDISRESPPAGEFRSGAAGVLIGLLLLALVWKRPERGPKVLLLLFILAFGSFAVWKGLATRSAHLQAVEHLARGNVEVAEGIVTGFVAGSADGRTDETFTVSGRAFRIRVGSGEPGLDRTSTVGGPIRKDASLRISYAGQRILKVEELTDAPTR